MEKSEAGSRKCKGNEVKPVNPSILRLSCLSCIDDGNIPEWLLVEVLVRLPVKSVFRFKLVSKKWLSIILDPYFVRLYVSRASLLSQQPWTIVPFQRIHTDSQFSPLDYELLELLKDLYVKPSVKDLYAKPSVCVVDIPSIHKPQEEKMYFICGVSNGLVLYLQDKCLPYDYGDRNYYICNPLTGHCIALPPLACTFDCNGWGFHTHVEDGFLKSYRVVRVERLIGESNGLKFQVYVSEIGEWKDFIVPSKILVFSIHKTAAVLNGILHWVAARNGIIAYDPCQNPENMHVIAFPGDNSKGKNELNSLCVECQGKLRFLEVGRSIMSGVAFPSFKVWVLNDYSSGDWCLQHNISHVDLQYDPNVPCKRLSTIPMYFHPFDTDIVYLNCDGLCVSYNIKTRKLQVVHEIFRHWWDFSFLYVIPHWPTSMPCPSHGAI